MKRSARPEGNILFEEKQDLPRWILFIVMSPALVITAVSFSGWVPETEQKELWIALAIVIPVQVLVYFLIRSLRLEKLVTASGLYYKWASWQKDYSFIQKEKIQSVQWRRAPIFQRGVRWVPGYGRVYCFSPGEGIQLYLADGKMIFFSAADKFALGKAMEQLGFVNLNFSAGEF
jgi:hypothetical protein